MEACDLLRQDLKVAPQSSRCSVAYFLLGLICCAGVLKVMANHSGIKRSWQLDWNTLALIACVSSWPNQPCLHDFNTKHATSHPIGLPILKKRMILWSPTFLLKKPSVRISIDGERGAKESLAILFHISYMETRETLCTTT